MEKHFCIFTQSPLLNAPRVVKEANAFAKMGHQVTVYALWYDASIVVKDIALLHKDIVYKAGINLIKKKAFSSLYIRMKRRIARALVRYLNVESTTALGYDFSNYFKKLKDEKAAIYIGHEEMSMALAKKLIHQGHKVGFDFEDWHSKDLLPKDRAYRPVQLLEKLELFLLQNTYFCYTTSLSMSEAMAKYYATKAPAVIYNSFLKENRASLKGASQDSNSRQVVPSFYWFSQVISEGRGLELLFEALQHTKQPFELHLRGAISEAYRHLLHNKTPKHTSLYVHDVVHPNVLIGSIAAHDIGLAIEEAIPENKNLTISNKIFHFLQAGIGIIATETLGQLEVFQQAPHAILVVKRDAIQLAQTMDALVLDKEKRQKMKQASWEAGAAKFCYENNLLKLKELTE